MHKLSTAKPGFVPMTHIPSHKHVTDGCLYKHVGPLHVNTDSDSVSLHIEHVTQYSPQSETRDRRHYPALLEQSQGFTRTMGGST